MRALFCLCRHALNHYFLLLFCNRKERWSGVLWHLWKHGGHAGEGRDGSLGAFTERRAAETPAESTPAGSKTWTGFSQESQVWALSQVCQGKPREHKSTRERKSIGQRVFFVQVIKYPKFPRACNDHSHLPILANDLCSQMGFTGKYLPYVIPTLLGIYQSSLCWTPKECKIVASWWSYLNDMPISGFPCAPSLLLKTSSCDWSSTQCLSELRGGRQRCSPLYQQCPEESLIQFGGQDQGAYLTKGNAS